MLKASLASRRVSRLSSRFLMFRRVSWRKLLAKLDKIRRLAKRCIISICSFIFKRRRPFFWWVSKRSLTTGLCLILWMYLLWILVPVVFTLVARVKEALAQNFWGQNSSPAYHLTLTLHASSDQQPGALISTNFRDARISLLDLIASGSSSS